MSRKKKAPHVDPEWPHMVEVADIGDKPMKLSISPGKAEREALVKRLGVVSLDEADAAITLTRDPGSMVVNVQGRIKGRVTQNCVVTLEPVETAIDEEFEGWYADPAQAVSLTKARHDKQAKKGRGEMPILDESEDPEPIVDGQIDVGELATQYLSLGINPYPHAEGVRYEVGDEDSPAEIPETRKNPFAALKDWKAKQE